MDFLHAILVILKPFIQLFIHRTRKPDTPIVFDEIGGTYERGDHHGIGLLNVKAVVDKYGGDMVLSCDENEFKAVVIL